MFIPRALAIVAVLLIPAVAQGQPAASPVGLWRTVDDNTGKERGEVRIFENQGVLYGRIEKLFEPAAAGKVCTKCDDDRRGKPLVGLDIIRGVRADADGGWGGGEILDPESGSIYRASLRLSDGGRKLTVRGYLLVSMLGRSQTWIREP